MQPKPRFSPLGIIVLLVVIILVGGVVVLMKLDVPAPKHPIEQQLDAKALTGQKQ